MHTFIYIKDQYSQYYMVAYLVYGGQGKLTLIQNRLKNRATLSAAFDVSL